MGQELPHVDVIFDDRMATHRMRREPGRDLLSALGAGSGRSLVYDAAGVLSVWQASNRSNVRSGRELDVGSADGERLIHGHSLLGRGSRDPNRDARPPREQQRSNIRGDDRRPGATKGVVGDRLTPSSLRGAALPHLGRTGRSGR
jgi:hypothetical protein